MKSPRTDWRTLRCALRTMPHPASSRGLEVFWSDFHARRVLHPQRPAVARPQILLPYLLPALAAAGVAIFLIGGMLLARGWSTHVARASMEGRYAAVAVLTDEPAPATMSGVGDWDADDDAET